MTSNYLTTPIQLPKTKVQTTIIGGRAYRYGARGRTGGYFVREVRTGAYISLPSMSAIESMFARMRAACGETPTPTTPAAIALYPVVQIAAVATTPTEAAIELNTCPRCHETVVRWAMCDECAHAVARELQPHDPTLRNQAFMMAKTGIDHPLRAYDALQAEWLEKHEAGH